MAQWLAQKSYTLKVVGSSPAQTTKQYKYKNICYICIDEIFDNFDNYNAAMVE